MREKKIGILTGGGDTASLNAIIAGVVCCAGMKGYKVLGFRRGWKGVLENDHVELREGSVDSWAAGTMLLSSRTNLDSEEKLGMARENLEKNVDGLVAIGGDDTLTAGRKLIERTEMPVSFVTKTIDNDVGRNGESYGEMINYFTSGFLTAAWKAGKIARELRSTARSHERIIFLETMGRSPGWLALSSYSGEPDFILVPEAGIEFEDFKGKLERRYKERGYAIVAVAEGARYKNGEMICEGEEKDVFGHKKLGGAAEILAKRIKKEMKIENVNSVNPGLEYRCGVSREPGEEPRALEGERRIVHQLGMGAAGNVIDRRGAIVEVTCRDGENICIRDVPIEEAVVIEDGKIVPRRLDPRFYDRERYNISEEGKEYFRVLKI